MKQRLFFTFILICFSSSIFAQLFGNKKFPRKGEEADLFEQAEGMLEDQNFHDAMLDYEKLLKDNPDEPILKFRLGICYLYEADKIEKSLEYLKEIDYKLYSNENVEYYLARAYHLNSKYTEALEHFEGFKANKNSDKDLKEECSLYINNCKNGIELSKNMLPYSIKNMGAPINTEASEYAPVITSDVSLMMFTYRGPNSTGGLQAPFTNIDSKHKEYYEDVFMSTKDEKGNWKNPEKLPEPINNEQNNATVSISGDGQQMFMFNSVPGDLGSISFSKLYGEEWSVPELIPGDVNSDSWEGHISLSSDRKYMIFASERPGGWGGIDLYSAELQNDFTWGNVQNLGPEINTEYDEHGPFIHPSGQFLIFSSKGHNSVGGYDLFKCLLINDSIWGNPENMGLPLNTPLDDIFYVISGDGKNGYYSSGKAGGFGQQDIYVTSPSIFGVNIFMAEVKGFVTLNDQPVEANVKIEIKGTGKEKYNSNTNSETGKYLADLNAGKEYLLTFTIPGLAPQTRVLDVTQLHEFKSYEIHVQFYKKELIAETKLQYLKPGDKVIEEAILADGKFSFKNVFEKKDAYFKLLVADDKLLKEVKVANPNLEIATAYLENDKYYRFPKDNAEISIEDLLIKYADYTNGKLKYHVQIGAYVMPANFNYGAATKYGKVELQKLEDQITRFVIGTTDKLSEARILCQKIKDAGITDAFVTGEYEGKRYMLRDLALNRFFSEE